MSKEGSVSFRLKKVEKDLLDEEKRWKDAGLPGPGPIYRMNNDEFMHHTHLLALSEIIKDRLGMTDDEMNLYLKEKFLEEVKNLYEHALAARQAAQRAAIVDGVTLLRPPKPEI